MAEKLYRRLLGVVFVMIACSCFWQLGAAQSADQYPYNATGELRRKTDSMTLVYKLDLHGHRPAEGNIVGQLKIFNEQDLQHPLADLSIKQLSKPDPDSDEMQVAFMIPNTPGKAALFFRRARLVYDKWNDKFCFHPAYKSNPEALDAYLTFPVDGFRLDAHLRPVSDDELVEMRNEADSIAAAASAKAVQIDTTGYKKYLGDGTWRGNLRARDQLYKSSGFRTFWWGLVVIWAAFLVWMLPKAIKAGQVVPLLLAAFCCLMVNFYGRYPFWVVMPAFMISYPMLYYRVHPYSYVKVIRWFKWCSVGTLVLLWMLYYNTWGWSSIRELFGWLVAGALSWYCFIGHLGKSCCRNCGAYGRHKKLSEKLVRREVRRSRIHDDNFDHTEVRSDEIINWYNRKYGVRVDVVETFNVFYECRSCGHIFKNEELKHKSSEKW